MLSPREREAKVTPRNRRLVIPALRAHMGDWIYYVAFMKMRDIAERISVAEEIHTSKSLNEFIQRELQRTTHAAKIKEYLLTQPQRLFNALVVGVYGGAPRWYELAIKENDLLDPEDLPHYMTGALGILILGGSEKLFAIDGQHRVVGIRQAIEVDSGVEEEEVSIIFVAHTNDAEGLTRTRRLFTTLNRYAKPVGKYEIIALDEDDVIAITTRRLVEEHALFRDKVSPAKGKNIPTRDDRSFTTIVALYDALDILLRDRYRGWKDFKRFRPSEEVIERFYERAVNFWDMMTDYYEPLQTVRDSDPRDNVASEYRHREGGHLLFRPIGLLLVVNVIRTLLDCGQPLSEAIQKVSRVPMDIAKEPWSGLLWDTVNRRMITAGENQKAAKRLLFYAVGGDLTTIKTTLGDLRHELAGLLNLSVEKVKLPQYG
jgi:DNA sulfur modification protein DndB